MSGGTAVSLQPAVSVIGLNTPVSVQATNPHGVRSIRAYVEQAGTRFPVFEQTAPATRFLFWRRREEPRSVTFDAGKDKAPRLQEGKARVIVEAVSNDFRGRKDTAVSDVTVVLAPP